MGAGVKLFNLPLFPPKPKKNLLRTLRAWKKRDARFIVVTQPSTGKISLWEIDDGCFSLEYTFRIEEIDTRKKIIHLSNFSGPNGFLLYENIESVSKAFRIKSL